MSAERTNVVLGAGSGMGAAVAARLAGRGPLLLADRDGDRVAEVAAGLGSGVASMACDVTEQADVDALVAATGRLGALVLTAGLSPSMASGRPIWAVNLFGTDRVLRACEPVLETGSVALCFSSMSAHMLPPSAEVEAILDDPASPSFFDDLAAMGLDPDDPRISYALSKLAVLRLVRHRAKAWGAVGARLLSLSPGIIDTGMGRLEAANEPYMAQMVEASALAREGRPEELAAVAAFLVSDEASFMTGTDVLVDGGAIAALQA
jgi:NAD(P)-dependent dehydrogenase (short-subunit alcohol dehydrogenase family)